MGAVAPAGGGGGGGTVLGLGGGGGAAASGAGGGGVGSPGGGVDPAGGSVLLMQCSFVGTEVGDVALDGDRGYAVPRCDRAEHSPSSGHMTGPRRAIRDAGLRGRGALAGITSEDGPMSRKPPSRDIDESELSVGHAKDHAAGPTAVAVTMKRAIEQMGVRRATKALLKLNQVDGFDCQGCAWPDPAPEHRHTAEFCENGAKAVTEEATRRHIGREFFAAHPLVELEDKTDYWLGQQGRIIEPMVLRPGGSHYEPITWDDAFDAGRPSTCAGWPARTRRCSTRPGKTSNEAAFVYQLFARALGTNNLPDCSNMCHESTSVALAEVIGIGKGSVTLEDVHTAELIVIAGQNPGTNHPRMLSALETAKKNGAKIVSINPLREAGLVRFKNPQTPRGVVGRGTALADLHLPIRVNGDLALFQAIGALLLEWDAVDHDFVEQFTSGFEEYAAHVKDLDWDQVHAATGLTREQIEECAAMFRDSSRDRDLLGDGADPAPQLGRDDQGDRQRGVPPGQHRQAGRRALPGARPLQRAGRPDHGHLGAAQAGLPRRAARRVPLRAAARARLRHRRGGQGAGRRPGPGVLRDGRQLRLRGLRHRRHRGGDAQRRAHRARLDQAEPLARRPRPDRADPPGARAQREGPDRWPRAAGHRRGLDVGGARLEGAARAGVRPAALRGRHRLLARARDPRRRARHPVGRLPRRLPRRSGSGSPAWCPAARRTTRRCEQPGGFTLPHPPRDSREFPTETGKAIFSASPLEVLEVPEGHLLLQTLRSHDQFNTTIYGLDDRYRGIKNGRRVVFVHPDDIEHLGWQDGDHVDLVSVWHDGSERCATEFRIVAYDQPRGCAAAYYPETNPLVPLDSKAEGSNTPTSKSVIIRLEKPAGRRTGVITEGEGHEVGHKRATDPIHQS